MSKYDAITMADLALKALADSKGETPLQEMQAAYAGLTLAVKRILGVYEDHSEINGHQLPGPVQTQEIIPMSIEEWISMLRGHDDGLANAVQDEKDVADGLEPSGTGAWTEFQRARE